MTHDPITRPEGLLPEILRGSWLLECSWIPVRRIGSHNWYYVGVVETGHGGPATRGGAGACIDMQRGLVQTLSFTAEEMDELRRRLAALSLPVLPGWCMTLDGADGCVRIHNGQHHMDLVWAGAPPKEWDPVLGLVGWMDQKILDRAVDDALRDG